MTRRIEICEQSERVLIEFPYDRKLLDVVRSLPSRRFDREHKRWSVPLEQMEAAVGRLTPHGFELGELVSAALTERGLLLCELERQSRREFQPFLDEARLPPGTWTIASLNREVSDLLRGAFREEFWVAAEIQSFDRNRRGGPAFFELVHRPFLGADPSARVSAVIWPEERAAIEQALKEDGAAVTLRDGLMVRFLARADFYAAQGRYQLSISEIDLAYTSGTIHQNREVILRHLDEQGIINENAGKALQAVPLRVGLITSQGSDALADFIDELRSSGFGFQIGFFPTRVQGAQTEAGVLSALAHFNRHAEAYDVVAIVRGGGARSDLAYFDTVAIGEAICRHRLKVIVGVGHQRDQCLLDFIAHSEKTPTAAGQALVARVQEYIERQNEVEQRLIAATRHRLEQRQAQLGLEAERALRVMGHRLEYYARKVERLGERFEAQTTRRLEREARRFERISRAIPQSARARLQIARVERDFLSRRLEKSPPRARQSSGASASSMPRAGACRARARAPRGASESTWRARSKPSGCSIQSACSSAASRWCAMSAARWRATRGRSSPARSSRSSGPRAAPRRCSPSAMNHPSWI